MDLPTALAYSCDTYFYQLGELFYGLPKNRAQPLQKWAAIFGFGSITGADFGPEAPGLVPTIGWRMRTYTRKTDQGLAGRPPLEAGRLDPARDRPEGPARDAAADGALLRADRERRLARHAARARWTSRTRTATARADAAPPAPQKIRRRRRRDPGRAAGSLGGDAPQLRDLVRRLRQVPGLDRGQDRHRGEDGDAARLHRRAEPVVVVRLRSDRQREARRLRA